MYRLVYISTQVRSLTPAESDRLLARAGQRNAAAGLTGALLDYGGYYLQVLEGGQGAVESTFERIRVDPRHQQVVVVERSGDRTRRFEQWSMIRVDVGPARDRTVEAFLHALALAPDAARAESAVALLAALSQRSHARHGGPPSQPALLAPALEPPPGTAPLTPPSRA